jgi:hypothetical protein
MRGKNELMPIWKMTIFGFMRLPAFSASNKMNYLKFYPGDQLGVLHFYSFPQVIWYAST